MPPITSASGPATPHNAQTDTENAEFVYPGESRLSEVAEPLGVDTNRLLKANPQIADPNNLLPGQEIRLPQAPPPVPMRDDGGEQLVQKNYNLPRAPVGDPIAESAMKAKFAQQTVPADEPDSTGEEEEMVSRPDPETQEWVDAQVKLDQLGLPRTPPDITNKDFENLSKRPEAHRGPGNPSRGTEDVELHLSVTARACGEPLVLLE